MSRRTLLSLLRRYSPLLLVAMIVGWGAWYVGNHPAEITAVKNLSPGWLLLLFSLAAAKLISTGAFTKIIVYSMGINLGFLEWFGLSAISAMGNYLTPFRGGAAVRAVYLKSRHDLSYSLFLSTLSILYVLTFATSAALGLLASVGLYVWLDFFNKTMVLFFTFLLLLPVGFLALIKVKPRLFQLRNRGDSATLKNRGYPTWLFGAVRWLLEMTNKIMEGWQSIFIHPRTLVRLVGASILNASVTLLMIHFSFAALTSRLPLLQSLVLSSLFMISSMIPITPSGLGVAELALVLASRGFVEDSSLSVLSAGLNRSVMMLSSIVWGTLFSYILGRYSLRIEEGEPD